MNLIQSVSQNIDYLTSEEIMQRFCPGAFIPGYDLCCQNDCPMEDRYKCWSQEVK